MGKQKRYHSPSHGRSRFSNGVKLLIALALLAIIAVASFFALSTSQPGSSLGSSLTATYPQSVAPTFFSTPTVSSGGSKVSVPTSVVNDKKLTFVDLKLPQTTDTLEYQGRTIPISLYKGGNYLPLLLISTPSGNTVAGVRVCEPCGSFSFHIVDGKNLKCDVCGAEWDVETFAGVSGGCQSYPPPKLSANTSGDNVEVDLTSLGTTVNA